jgi:hypothetical protein
VDVDAQNQDDPQACSAYAAAIFQHLRDSEVRQAANAAEMATYLSVMHWPTYSPPAPHPDATFALASCS